MSLRRVSRPICRRLAALLAVVFAGCPRPALNVGEPRLEAWLFCDDCDRGQRDSAAALGNRAVQTLDGTLRALPPLWRANSLQRYGAAARRIGLSGQDSTNYVARFMANFTASVAGRSAITLGDIGTAEAISVLRQALADSAAREYRADVIRDIRQALIRATTAPVDGPYPTDGRRFLDTVWITRGGNIPWELDEQVTLHGAPFPTDVGVGYRNNNLELGFVPAAVPGGYVFTINNAGPNQATQYGTLRITTFPGAPVIEARDGSAGPFPLTSLMALTRRTNPPDPSRLFRFAPASNLSVTATADWPGPATIALVWDACADRLAVAPQPGTVTGRVVQGVSATESANANVTLVGTSLGVITGATGTFSITNVPPGWNGRVRASKIGFAAKELSAWEGAAGIILRLGTLGGGSPVTSGPSAISAGQVIPGGECRLLTVLRTDTTTAPAVVRLRVTSSP